MGLEEISNCIKQKENRFMESIEIMRSERYYKPINKHIFFINQRNFSAGYILFIQIIIIIFLKFGGDVTT